MRVVVIGATGRIGKRVVRLLVEHGHDVLGANRRPDRAAHVLDGIALETAVADTNDPGTVAPLVEDADVVVLATAPTREDPAAYLLQTGHVLDAVRGTGARLLAISSYLALLAPDGRTMLEAEPAHPYFRPIEEVYAAQAASFRAEQEIDWLLVAPPAELFPYGEVTRRWRVGRDVLLTTDDASASFKETSTLSMEDLATYVVDEIERPAHHHELVTVAY